MFVFPCVHLKHFDRWEYISHKHFTLGINFFVLPGSKNQSAGTLSHITVIKVVITMMQTVEFY